MFGNRLSSLGCKEGGCGLKHGKHGDFKPPLVAHSHRDEKMALLDATVNPQGLFGNAVCMFLRGSWKLKSSPRP